MSAIELPIIGVVRSAADEKALAPRQGVLAGEARVELSGFASIEDALADLDGFERIWLVFVFDRAQGSYRPKVQPPRSDVRRGVLATRSPHRPSPVGLSAVRLVSIEGATLHVDECDLLDGTPVLDVKPYIPYADAFPRARAGWLDALGEGARDEDRPADPVAAWSVSWSDDARARLAWVEAAGEVALRGRAEAALALGPRPHAYRRIKRAGDALVLAVKDWRLAFAARPGERTIEILALYTGYRPSQLFGPAAGAPELHRRFAEAFGAAPPGF